MSSQLQYHLYQPALPHVSGQSSHPAQVIQQTFFMSPSLREDLQRRQEATAQLPTHKLLADTSGDLGQYWGLIPLDKKIPDHHQHSNNKQQTGVFGYRTWTYKCTSELDGKAYVLKRIEGAHFNFVVWLERRLC
jgi:PAB-dependent poly(A)-specific ribonuclease subunit 3